MEGKAEELHIFGNYSFCDSYADIVASMDVAARYAEPPRMQIMHGAASLCMTTSFVHS